MKTEDDGNYKPKNYIPYKKPLNHLKKIGRAISKRDFTSKIYAEWRRNVKKRDINRCRWPGCDSTNVVCHHIRRWADNPTLRFSVGNGICLCKKHHKMVTGKEEQYAAMLLGIISRKRGDFE